MTKRQIDAYRRKLAKIEGAHELSPIAFNAVVSVWVYGQGDDPIVGTLVAVRHEIGVGLFGQSIETYVKLCPECVHKRGANCKRPAELEWLHVLGLESVVRNGDKEVTP